MLTFSTGMLSSTPRYWEDLGQTRFVLREPQNANDWTSGAHWQDQ